MTNYHPVTTKITDLLKEHNLWFETFTHEPAITSEDAAKLRHGYTLEQGAKAMIVKVKRREPIEDKNNDFCMLVLPAHTKIDTKKAKQAINAKDLNFATVEEVEQITNGVQRGGVPPFGNLFGLQVVADPTLFQNEKIIFNAGDRCFSVAMKSADYRTIVEPLVLSII